MVLRSSGVVPGGLSGAVKVVLSSRHRNRDQVLAAFREQLPW